jgi:alanine racemase
MCAVAHSLAEQVQYYGVSSFDEARTLRADGIMHPILVLGTILPHEFESAIEHHVTLTVSDVAYARALNYVASRLGRQCSIHIKVDTGMGRWGFAYKTAFNDILTVASLSHIHAEGMFTHFPVSDKKRFDYTDRQVELFKELVDALGERNVTFRFLHAANSGGILHFKDSHFNLVRPGIMIYGYYPSPGLRDGLSLEQPLTVKSRVALIKEVASRRGIGYGRMFITPKKTRICVVPIGYSHGYPYALSRRVSVLIHGVRYPIAGNVCMDYIMVDLGDNRTIKAGDEVVLLGTSGTEYISANELAAKAKTIAYEIISNLSAHIPRVYINEG